MCFNYVIFALAVTNDVVFDVALYSVAVNYYNCLLIYFVSINFFFLLLIIFNVSGTQVLFTLTLLGSTIETFSSEQVSPKLEPIDIGMTKAPGETLLYLMINKIQIKYEIKILRSSRKLILLFKKMFQIQTTRFNSILFQL